MASYKFAVVVALVGLVAVCSYAAPADKEADVESLRIDNEEDAAAPAEIAPKDLKASSSYGLGYAYPYSYGFGYGYPYYSGYGLGYYNSYPRYYYGGYHGYPFFG